MNFFVVAEGPYYDKAGYSSNHYDYTPEEFDILAKIIQREAGGESTAGKIAVGNVVVNRVLCGRWGKTIDAVKGQFAYNPDTVPKRGDRRGATVLTARWRKCRRTLISKTSGGPWFYTLWGQMAPLFLRQTAGITATIPPALYERVYKYAQYGCKTGKGQSIQLMLKALGYSVNTDEKFDKTTRAALIAFQKDAGLSADGVAGPKTVEALIKKYGVDKYIKDFAS